MANYKERNAVNMLPVKCDHWEKESYLPGQEFHYSITKELQPLVVIDSVTSIKKIT